MTTLISPELPAVTSDLSLSKETTATPKKTLKKPNFTNNFIAWCRDPTRTFSREQEAFNEALLPILETCFDNAAKTSEGKLTADLKQKTAEKILECEELGIKSDKKAQNIIKKLFRKVEVQQLVSIYREEKIEKTEKLEKVSTNLITEIVLPVLCLATVALSGKMAVGEGSARLSVGSVGKMVNLAQPGVHSGIALEYMTIAKKLIGRVKKIFHSRSSSVPEKVIEEEGSRKKLKVSSIKSSKSNALLEPKEESKEESKEEVVEPKGKLEMQFKGKRKRESE